MLLVDIFVVVKEASIFGPLLRLWDDGFQP